MEALVTRPVPPARMLDTPTLANLLSLWASGGPVVRRTVYAYLRAHPAEAAAAEPFLRDELAAALPGKRVLAAEAMLELYADGGAAEDALAWALRQGGGAVADAMPVARLLPPARLGRVLADFAATAPDEFSALPPADLRWIGAALARSGPEAVPHWLCVYRSVRGPALPALFVGLATAAPQVPDDLGELAAALVPHPPEGPAGWAAGAAVWRVTWRVRRDWLAALDPHSPGLKNDPPLLVLLTEAVTEHLGRRPDLAPVARALLVQLFETDPEAFAGAGRRLIGLGGRGWAVLLPLVGEPCPVGLRAFVFEAAAPLPAVAPLIEHHALNAVRARATGSTIDDALLRAAGALLAALGRGSAVPLALDAIDKAPGSGLVLVPTLKALAPAYPGTAARLARTLNRLPTSGYGVKWPADLFTALAGLFAELSPDGAVEMVTDPTFDAATGDALLQSRAWKNAQPDARARHARRLADALASPLAAVRVRAADALRHYPDRLPALWPALVAALTDRGEDVATRLLPLFRHLEPVADAAGGELHELFREPDPGCAARACVAAWLLGRAGVPFDELRAVVLADEARGWQVLRAVVDRADRFHRLMRDLAGLFAAASPQVAARVRALLNPPETPEEANIAALLPRADDPAAPAAVDWNGVRRGLGDEVEAGLLLLALMSGYGSAGVATIKIPLIKHQRALTGSYLADSKRIVEGAMSRLGEGASATDRREAVRSFFGSNGLPPVLVAMLDHRFSWYRWAGLELLDAWGEPELVPPLIEDRVWDRSPLVRARALRMTAAAG